MKLRTIMCAVTLVGVSAVITHQAVSQEKKGPGPEMKPPTTEQIQAMMKKWQAVASPGEHHKHLEVFVGDWKTTTRMWMGGPGTPPSVSKGTSKVKWVLDGRFLLEEFNGEMKMPGPDGKPKAIPFKGLGMTGYDKYKNMYVYTWADSMGTQLLTMKGTRHPSGKVFTAYGEMDEPMLDVQDRTVKYVSRIIDSSKHVFEIYDLHAGEDYKVIEITYERM